MPPKKTLFKKINKTKKYLLFQKVLHIFLEEVTFRLYAKFEFTIYDEYSGKRTLRRYQIRGGGDTPLEGIMHIVYVYFTADLQ